MTQKYQVKVSMKQAAIVETGIVLKQGDFGMQLEIEVLDFDATGTTPQIVFRKAMGAVESTTITVSGNKYTYTFKGTELDTPGKCFCDLKLKNSTTQRISTASFMFKVVADTLDGLAEESSSYSDTLSQLLGTAITVKAVSSSYTSLDQFSTMGMYSLPTSKTYTNDPIGQGKSRTLITYGDSSTNPVSQVIFDSDSGDMYLRSYSSSTWGNWVPVSNTLKIIIENNLVKIDKITGIVNGEYTPGQTDANWSRTDYTPIYGLDSLSVFTSRRSVYNGFYNAQKTLISGFTAEIGLNTITVPNGAVYYVIANRTEALTGEYVTNPIHNQISFVEEMAEGSNETDSIIINDFLGDIWGEPTPKTISNTVSDGMLSGIFAEEISQLTAANYHYSWIAVLPGKRYDVAVYYTSGYDGRMVAAITDSNNRIIDFINSDVPISAKKTYTLIAPSNGAKLWFCGYAASEASFIRGTNINEYDPIPVSESMEAINENIGGKYYNVVDKVDIYTNEAVYPVSNTDIGQTIAFGSSTSYWHTYIAVTPGDAYKVKTEDATNFGHYLVYFTDANDVVVGRDMYTTAQSAPVEANVVVPSGASKMYISSHVGSASNFEKYTSCYELEYKTIIEALQQIDNEIKEYEDSPLSKLPEYYTSEWISQRVEAVKENTNIKNGLSFAFITDVHMQANYKNSKYLMKYVLDNTSVPFCVFGGDVPRAFGTRTELLADAEAWQNWLRYVKKVFQIRGNHDYTIKTSAEESTGYTESDGFTYNHLMRAQEWEVIGEPGQMYYILENKIQKIRMIFLNMYQNVTTGEVPFGVQPLMNQDQHDWVIAKIKEVENYHFIFFTHASPDSNIPGGGGGAGLPAIATAVNTHGTAVYDNDNINVHINEDFSDTTNDVICFISGHNHQDKSETLNSVLYITTTSDATYNNDPDVQRTGGTTTEQAFDIFSIDTENKTVKTVRFGGGVNRTWNY